MLVVPQGVFTYLFQTKKKLKIRKPYVVQLNQACRRDWSALREANIPTFQFRISVTSAFHQIFTHVPNPFHSQQVVNILNVMLWSVHQPPSARRNPSSSPIMVG